jgi:hypothetical protein
MEDQIRRDLPLLFDDHGPTVTSNTLELGISE